MEQRIADNKIVPTYKAEVRVCSPVFEREGLSNHTCFVGVSLGNPNFIGGKLQAMIRWISQRFPHCVFLLGDHVHRLTLQIRQGLDEQESVYKALSLGDNYISSYGDMLRRGGNYFTIIRGSDIHAENKVGGYKEALASAYQDNELFRDSVEMFARKYIARAESEESSVINHPVYLQASCRYVIEELAETCYMLSQGYRVLVYPGSLAIFQQIAEGFFTGLPKELDRLINVGLRLKRRGKKRCMVSS